MSKEKVFLDAMFYAMVGENPSKAFENEERREQIAAVRNQRLPKKTNGGMPDGYKFRGITDDMDYDERSKILNSNILEFTKQQYEKMGIKIIDEYDDLFYTVELPDGWEIKATDHSMWNDVIDNNGRKRVSFFYKGAFYDRDAFSNFEHRYSFTISPFDDYESDVDYEDRKFKPWRLFITDCGNKIKKLKEMVVTTNEEYFKIDDVLREVGVQYLNENYPEWLDINAYWN